MEENKEITENKPNTVRRYKKDWKRVRTSLTINRGIIGDSIETMVERLREGDGEDAIEDRDLVYNDNESANVNPITNIRTDPFEVRLEEKIGEYEHKERKINRTKEAEEAKKKEAEDAKKASTEVPKSDTTGTE